MHAFFGALVREQDLSEICIGPLVDGHLPDGVMTHDEDQTVLDRHARTVRRPTRAAEHVMLSTVVSELADRPHDVGSLATTCVLAVHLDALPPDPRNNPLVSKVAFPVSHDDVHLIAVVLEPRDHVAHQRVRGSSLPLEGFRVVHTPHLLASLATLPAKAGPSEHDGNTPTSWEADAGDADASLRIPGCRIVDVAVRCAVEVPSLVRVRQVFDGISLLLNSNATLQPASLQASLSRIAVIVCYMKPHCYGKK
mmetsp:Transcript_80803/g.210791  ORF Transcript_80803/g.210791 Transcript_80803/m.210791 type:complete len:252 (-) Transcript_80803:147-902(-)